MDIRITLKRAGWEFWVGTAVLAFALVGLALVPSQVLEPKFGTRSIAFSPKTFPVLTLSAIALLGAVMAMRAAFGQTDGAAPPEGLPRTRVLQPMLIMLGYVTLLEYLGTLAASALAIAALAWVFGTRRWSVVLPLAVVVPILVWLVFKVGLRVFLPEGRLFGGVL